MASVSPDNGIQSGDSCPAPTPTSNSNLRRLFPRITPPPTPCTTNEVVIHLATTVVIPDYNRYFAPTPIASFQPSYLALADGSLVANPFFKDLHDSNISLLVTGMLAMLFLRNIFVSGDYIHRGGVKRKTLFYWLFISQLLAPICFIPEITGYLDKSVDCMMVLCMSRIASSISLSILISGILGYKAYKCLEDSKIVLTGLVVFTAGSATLTLFDVLTLRAVRRISGGCTRTPNLKYIKYYSIVQFAESLFICLSFVYAVYRAYQLPAARGRVSLEFSEKPPSDKADSPTGWQTAARRGWWDYVPNSANSRSPNDNPPPLPNNLKWSDIFSQLQPQRQRAGSEAKLLRLSSVAASPSIQTPRSPALRIVQPSTLGPKHVEIDKPSEGRGTSPVPSSLSRISKFMPRMILFRTVMKDELCYTAIITGTCVLVAILSIIGLNLQNGLTVNGWILLNWGVISALAIHSFGRVVRRNERDAILQHPTTWDSALSADKATAEAYCRGRCRRPWTPVSVASHRRQWQGTPPPKEESDAPDDPFADPSHPRFSQHSWSSILAGVAELRTPSPTYSVGSLTREPLQSDQVLLPSVGDDFPTSGRTTPVVPHDESDGTLLQDLQNTIWCEPRVVRARDNPIDPVFLLETHDIRSAIISIMDDRLIDVLPIRFSNALSPKVVVHQFPLLTRPLQVPPSAAAVGKTISARIKPSARRTEIHVPADTRPEVWNDEKAKQLGAARVTDDLEKSKETKASEEQEPRLAEVRLSSEQIAHWGTPMLGMIRNGELHLHPISETHQFRPTLTYLDVFSRKNRRSRTDDSDSDDGPPPDPDEAPPVVAAKKEKKGATDAKEIQVTARKTDDKGGLQAQSGLSTARREMLAIIRAEEDEDWLDLKYHDTNTTEAADIFESMFSQNEEKLVCTTDATTFLNAIEGLSQ
ncbi:hypothetical protein PC9H_003793 [Pleurotus ostreatus]|uniref:Uncharacterized protein n=2 Tax=Pleurotus ostreatus TaxID=5322 RepID=A0A8H7A1I6_PLEOS|nr:uncharacterized protein PC9H_003793 [Pleurotus ostreatus]KAF7436959.1 hypothetical protein PC9H_003793 [Pleurotus ostreatus]